MLTWKHWLKGNIDPRSPTLDIFRGLEGKRKEILKGIDCKNPVDGINLSKKKSGFPEEWFDPSQKTKVPFKETRLVTDDFLFSSYVHRVLEGDIDVDEIPIFAKHLGIPGNLSNNDDDDDSKPKKKKKSQMSEEEKENERKLKLSEAMFKELTESLKNGEYTKETVAKALSELLLAGCLHRAEYDKEKTVEHLKEEMESPSFSPFMKRAMEKIEEKKQQLAAAKKKASEEKKKKRELEKESENSVASPVREKRSSKRISEKNSATGTPASPRNDNHNKAVDDDEDNTHQHDEQINNTGTENNQGLSNGPRVFSQSSYGSGGITPDPFFSDIENISPANKKQAIETTDGEVQAINFHRQGGKTAVFPRNQSGFKTLREDSGEDADDSDEDSMEDPNEEIADTDKDIPQQKEGNPTIERNDFADKELLKRFKEGKPEGFKGSYETFWEGDKKDFNKNIPRSCMKFQLQGKCLSNCRLRHLHITESAEQIQKINDFLDSCGFS